MSGLWPFIVFGVFAGSVYGLAAMGVVLTYKTVGVFNFAYGAVAMFCAFTYWQLHVGWHLSAWVVAARAPASWWRPFSGSSSSASSGRWSGCRPRCRSSCRSARWPRSRRSSPSSTDGATTGRCTPLFPTSTFLLGGHLHVGYDQVGMLLCRSPWGRACGGCCATPASASPRAPWSTTATWRR